MKSAAIAVLTLAIAVTTTMLAVAQPPGRRGAGGPAGPPSLVLEALDVDGDHVISAEEIANAVAALKKLDGNKDGKLTSAELHPFGGQGRGGPGGRGRGLAGPRGGPEARGSSATSFVDRILGFDANEDGKIAKAELPERMQGILARHDTNEDGVLDEAELEQMAARFGQGRDGTEGGRVTGRGGPRGFGGPGGTPRPEQFVERAMTFDGDKDGKLSKDELMKLAAEFSRRGGPGAGRGPGRPNGGNQRPSRPE